MSSKFLDVLFSAVISKCPATEFQLSALCNLNAITLSGLNCPTSVYNLVLSIFHFTERKYASLSELDGWHLLTINFPLYIGSFKITCALLRTGYKNYLFLHVVAQFILLKSLTIHLPDFFVLHLSTVEAFASFFLLIKPVPSCFLSYAFLPCFFLQKLVAQ